MNTSARYYINCFTIRVTSFLERSRRSFARPSLASVAAASRSGACGADAHHRLGRCRHLPSGTSVRTGQGRRENDGPGGKWNTIRKERNSNIYDVRMFQNWRRSVKARRRTPYWNFFGTVLRTLRRRSCRRHWLRGAEPAKHNPKLVSA